ncbi:unnamed protein product [Nesidiocoris tenuis]|uniref:Uncharacterized protein n=1 Tax=Nesidiocoris tenuis TaxID=355587 RepID=A0A6H5GAS7_9HEMI|nr:unnamed protein product [Nesidiocoris tenuis]
MEFLSSSGSDEDCDEKEVEEELYSVLHYNDFSQGIPAELLDKYEICSDSKEFRISLKPKCRAEARPVDDESGPSSRTYESDDSVIVKDVEREIVVLDDSEVEVTPTGLGDRTLEKVVEEYDAESDASCVEVGEITRKRKFSESSVICLTSDDELGLSLNTTEGGGFGGYDSDGNISDVVERSNFQWQDVASPSTWTDEMRKYYNSPCLRLRYFDHEKIRREIAGGECDEGINKLHYFQMAIGRYLVGISIQTNVGDRDATCAVRRATGRVIAQNSFQHVTCAALMDTLIWTAPTVSVFNHVGGNQFLFRRYSRRSTDVPYGQINLPSLDTLIELPTQLLKVLSLMNSAILSQPKQGRRSSSISSKNLRDGGRVIERYDERPILSGGTHSNPVNS